MKRRALILTLLFLCVGCLFAACAKTGGEEKKKYTVSLSSVEHGTLIAPQEAEEGEQIAVSAVPEEGYVLADFFVNSEKSALNFTMPARDVVLFAVFSPASETRFSLSVLPSEHGTLSLPDAAKAGETVSADVSADDGYEFVKLIVGGVDVFAESFRMPAAATEVRAVFRQVAVLRESELVVACTTYNARTYTNETAKSRWFFSYEETGIAVSVQVSDENLYENYYLNEVYYNDNIEFVLCKNTTSHTLPSEAFKVIVAADGSFYLGEPNGSGDYGNYKGGRDLFYGKNFYCTAQRTTEAENGFNGYAVETFVGYDLLGVTAAEARGALTIMPALRNTLYTPGGAPLTSWANFTWFNAQWTDPSTFPVCKADGSFDLRAVYCDDLFFGDSYFDRAYWGDFDHEFTDVNVQNIAVGGTQIPYWRERYEQIAAYKPTNIIVHIGINDFNVRLPQNRADKEGDTTVTNRPDDVAVTQAIIGDLKALFADLAELLPQTHFYWVTLPHMIARADNHGNVDVANEEMVSYAETCEYLTVIDLRDDTTIADAPALGAIDAYHIDVGGYPFYARAIRKALGLTYEEGGELYGGTGIFRSTWGADYSDDRDGQGTLYQNGTGTQYIMFNDLYAQEFYIEADITAHEVTLRDPAPKFGFTVVSRSHRMIFYVAATPQLTSSVVGCVHKFGHNQYDWSTVTDVPVAPLQFTGTHSVKMAVLRYEGKFTFYVNGVEVLQVSDEAFGGEPTAAGLFTFNTLLTAKNSAALTGAALADKLLSDPEADRDVIGKDKEWDL